MLASLLMFAAATIIGVLGAVHLLYTFHGSKLHPRDPELQQRMRAATLRITPATSVWNAWIGFNASHSLCALLFALVFGYLALVQPSVLFGSAFLSGVALASLAFLTWLGRRYWFRVPLTGIAIALVLACAAVVLARVG